MKNWCVYMLRCSDGSLYTGVTTDLKRRFNEHRNGSGSKYVRSRLPAEVAYVELGHDQSSALSREYEIKQLSKDDKERLCR
jgi:putative endonuclease